MLENFQDQKDWIGPLFYTVNKFIADTISAVNGGILFSENISGQEYQFDFTYKGATTFVPGNSLPSTVKFKWNLVNSPKSLVVTSAYEAATAVTDASGSKRLSPIILLVNWILDAQNFVEIIDAVKVSSGGGVSALTTNTRYLIKVRVTP